LPFGSNLDGPEQPWLCRGQAEQGRSTWFVVNQDGTAGINPGGFI
jgi:hypothetical protein